MPSVRVLLVTDLVDSTSLVERLGDLAAATMAEAHDRLARDLALQWHGREIDKSDGFLLMFDRPEDAVGYALAYHAALRTLEPPLAARAGLHLGPVVERPNSAGDIAQGAKPIEVDGIVKSIAARIMGLARGGQTLLSATARSALPDGEWRIAGHGHWQLKGVAEPVELFEAGASDAAFVPPADVAKAYRVIRDEQGWAPVSQRPSNLPVERDRFVGRADVLPRLACLFEDGARLVSLIGTGGIGKTRLALRYARDWRGEYSGGVCFCDLAAARGIDGIANALAQALHIGLGKSDPVLELGTALAGRGRQLIVLDNFEQIAVHAETTIGHWMERARHTRFIVTSRSVLGISGEQVLALQPLDRVEAAQLFRERVRATGVDDPRDPREAEAIARLVDLLDRLPLAIELAAARSRVMSPRTLLDRMSEQFRLLAKPGRPGGRQDTLEATLAWSWDLLSNIEQSVLMQLSVFEGGFALDDAEAVVDTADADAPWTVDTIQSLVQKSLLREIGPARFGMFQSTAAFVVGKRTAAEGDAFVALASRRHWRHFAAFEHHAPRRCSAELDNLVAACRRAVTGADTAAACSCLKAAWQGLLMIGPLRAIVALAHEVEGSHPMPREDRVKLLWVRARSGLLLGDQARCRRDLDEALALVEATDVAWRSRLLCVSGEQWVVTGQPVNAQDALRVALALSQTASDHGLVRDVANAAGTIAISLGDLREAQGHFERALALCDDDAADIRGAVLGNLGEVCMNQGLIDQARDYFVAALDAVARAGHRRWEGNIRSNLGLLHQEQGQAAEAREQFDAALKIARAIGYTRLEATVLCNVGIQLRDAGDSAASLDHHRRAVAMVTALGDARAEGQFRVYLAQALVAQGELDEARQCLACAEIMLRATSDLISLSLLLCEAAILNMQLGLASEACTAFYEAGSIASKLGTQAGTELGLALERAASRLAARSTRPDQWATYWR